MSRLWTVSQLYKRGVTEGAGEGVASEVAIWLGGVEGLARRGKGEAVITGTSVTVTGRRVGGVRGVRIGIGADGSGIASAPSSLLESVATRRREWNTIVVPELRNTLFSLDSRIMRGA